MKVTNLKIFWNNGSYETPIVFPDPNTFVEVKDANVMMDTIDIGNVVLTGFGTYAGYKDNFYFLTKTRSQDITKDVHEYAMIRDLNYALNKCEDLVIYGQLNKITDPKTAKDNLEYVLPILNDPTVVELVNATKDIEKSKLDIKKHKYKPKEKINVVTKEAGDKFIQQYEAIPNKATAKTNDAVIASLPTEPVDNGKKTIVDKYLDPFIDSLNNLNDFELSQITSTTTNLMGSYQIVHKKDKPISENLSPIEQLSKIDLENLEDIKPVNLDTLLPFANRIFEPLNIPSSKSNHIGYFDGVKFYPDQSPYTRTNYGRESMFPLGSDDFGITNKMKFARLNKSYDAFLELHISENTEINELKKIKDKLNVLDGKLKGRAGRQGAFFNYIDNQQKGRYIDSATPHTPFDPGGGASETSIPRDRGLSKGLPRDSSGEYDYEEILKWINNTYVETFSTYSTGGLDYFYFLVGGLTDRDGYGNIMAFDAPAERESIHAAIRDIYNYPKLINPEKSKNNILKVVLEMKGNPTTEDGGYYLEKKDMDNKIHLFDLVGTNYYLLINSGKTSLIVKNIEVDSTNTLIETYEINDNGGKHLHESINTKRILCVYNREYPINNKTNEIKDLKVTKLTGTARINPFENLFVKYESDYSYIFDVHNIQKEKTKETLSNFNAIEYQDSLINQRKSFEDIQLSKQELELARNKEDFEMKQAKLALDDQGSHAIFNTVIGAASTVAGAAMAVASGGLSAAAGGMAGIGKGLGADMGVKGVGSVVDTVYKFRELNRKYEALEYEKNYVNKSRILENFKLDTNVFRLEEEHRRLINRQSNLASVTFVSDREIAKRLQEIGNVGDVYMKVIKPSPKQMALINDHYGHYGIDCSIPKFNLTWKDYKDKTNVGGFKFITDINIMDPVLKMFVIGKFIRGVKLIRPNFI